MTRRTLLLLATILVLVGGVFVSALPASARPAHDVDPSTIDPHALALPASALPAGAVIDHSDVSDNVDADTSQTHALHNTLYETFHRITGYRMDFHYTAAGTDVVAGYLASIFPTPADARAAMDNATNATSIIAFLGQPLPDPCQAGEICKGYSGPNPNDGTKTALAAIFTRGPILIEAAAQVPSTTFTQLQSTMEAQVYSVASAVDVQVKAVLNGGTTSTSTGTTTTSTPASPSPTATNTPEPATPTATLKPTPKPSPKQKCKGGQHLSHGKCACKKGYVMKHGKCQKKKHK